MNQRRKSPALDSSREIRGGNIGAKNVNSNSSYSKDSYGDSPIELPAKMVKRPPVWKISNLEEDESKSMNS